MRIEALQRDIEAIYSLNAAPSVQEFFLSRKEVRSFLGTEQNPSPQVLLFEEKDQVSLGVYLGELRLRRIERQGLERTNLADFCTAAEEVSHFSYLLWSARNRRPVSLLDVELQGEIDKFLLASLYFSRKEDLFQRIFERVSFDRRIQRLGRLRYREANRLGGKFCRTLGELFDRGGTRRAALAHLRAFYRMNTQSRLARIDAL